MSDEFIHEPSMGRPQYVHVSYKEGVLIVRPIGPSVGQREAPIITDQVRNKMSNLGRDLRVVILDLSDVQMLASMGLGMCIDLRNHAHRLKAKTVLYGLRSDIAELFKMMRVDRLYTIAKTADDLRRYAA